MIANLKPYPAMKDSGVLWLGGVPAHWDVTRARYLFREVDRRSQTGAETHLSMSQKLGLVPSSMVEQQTLVSESYAGAKLCEADDLVLNRLKAHLGVFARAKQAGVISPDYTVLRSRRSLEVRYFEETLRSPGCRSELRIRAKGIVEGFWRLYTDDFYDICLPVPQPDEQAAIVRFLDHVDQQTRRYIGAKQKMIRLLEEQQQAIVRRAVTRGLDSNVRLKACGAAWLGDVPEHWEVRQIGHIASVGNGSTPSRGNAAYWAGGTYPWLNSSSVNVGTINQADQRVTERALRECHLPRVPAGSVLVAITGQGKTRGTAAVLEIEATINQHIAYITPLTFGRLVAPEYLRAFLFVAYPELRRISDDSGSTKGALTCEDLRHFRIALPPFIEQMQIVRSSMERTAAVRATLEHAQREVSLLHEYRARLIADVVTGKLDVRKVAAGLRDEPVEPEVPEADGHDGR